MADLYEYRVQVDTDTKQNASMVYFDFEGTRRDRGDEEQRPVRRRSRSRRCRAASSPSVGAVVRMT
jgi:hypothetical protein